ncbi:eukaryotic peptide chain release factor GTP-binding subunit-like [Lycium ferocissimum]|uniref:eukaryotic peptide chain release factor GTP-binding subunit-like n=1 Tax=Lycium ferocissimum TaxID=112874 RepID=UPI0028159114|nr:eukaryotic peptide chain release factor GTP-binding subunit-like [Lycium ferocissimum]
MEKFYRGLDPVTQSIANNAADGSVMIQNMVKENQDTQQTLFELAMNISLITKKFDETQIKKVNICEDEPSMPRGMYQTQEGPFHEGPPMQVEDANYVNISQGGYQRQNYQGGYQNQNQWRPQQGQGAYNNNSGNYNNNYGSMNQGSYNNSNNFGNKSSNPYIPPEGQSTEQGSSRVEAMLEKIRDISREQHPPKNGGLPSDTVSNSKNGGGGVDRVFTISTRSGKILQSFDKKVVELEPIDEEEEVQSEAPIIIDENLTDEKVADISKIVKEADDMNKQTVKGALYPLTHFKSKPPFP